MWAKQSTAATLIVGPILDSAGAEYTSAVTADLSISKNGGTLTALAAAASLTHIANGQYTLVLTTGNLDTLGRLQITCNKLTYQMPPVGLNVVPAMVFDSMVLGTDVLQSDTIQFGGTNGTFDAGKPTAVLDSASRLAIWNTLTTETFTADSFGDLLIISDGTNGREVKVNGAHHIAADVHEVQPSGLTASTDIIAIKAKTTNLPTDPADQSLVEAAITAATSPLATPAQVNAQVLDVLSVDTFGELSSPPAATSSLKDKLGWLFMWARNRSTQSATQRKLYADDATTIVSTETVGDDGATFTKGEAS